MGERFDFEMDLSMLDRPYFFLCDPDPDGGIWLTFHYGYPGSDSVLRFGVHFTGVLARPLIAFAGWKWDRAVAREAKRRLSRAS